LFVVCNSLFSNCDNLKPIDEK